MVRVILPKQFFGSEWLTVEGAAELHLGDSQLRGRERKIVEVDDGSSARLERLQLIHKMKMNGISRDKFYKIITTLSSLNIITEEPTQPDGRIKKIHTALTPRGIKIAEHLNQIKTILEE